MDWTRVPDVAIRPCKRPVKPLTYSVAPLKFLSEQLHSYVRELSVGISLACLCLHQTGSRVHSGDFKSHDVAARYFHRAKFDYLADLWQSSGIGHSFHLTRATFSANCTWRADVDVLAILRVERTT